MKQQARGKSSTGCGNLREKKENPVKAGKLVQNKIPEIISDDGKIPITRIIKNRYKCKKNNKVKLSEIRKWVDFLGLKRVYYK